MKVRTTLILMAFLGCSVGASAGQEFDGAAAYQYVKAQVEFGPRIPNTEGHRRTGDWILQHLRDTADSVEEQSFEHVTQDGDTLELRNLIGKFRPEMTERVLYVAHWDSRPKADQSANLGDQQRPLPGANDGASGVAVLLGVADVLARIPPTFGVDLVMVDGEDFGDFGQGIDVLLGARYYARHLDPAQPKPLFAVVFDMVGDADLTFVQESGSMARAPEVVERVWSTASRLGYGRIFRSQRGGPITDDHIPLLDAGIRAIDVIDFDYGPNNSYWHTVDDTPDKVSAESLQAVGDVAIALVR